MKITIKGKDDDKKDDTTSQRSYHENANKNGNSFSQIFKNHRLFLILLIVINLVYIATLFTDDSVDVDSEVSADVIVEVVNDDVDSAIKLVDSLDGDVPQEYVDALAKAKIYAYEMYLSKSGVYRQLTSSDGDKFSEESAGYAVKNLDVDWKENAVLRGKHYLDNQDMDLDMVYNHLASKDADRYLIDEAQYAIDKLK